VYDGTAAAGWAASRRAISTSKYTPTPANIANASHFHAKAHRCRCGILVPTKEQARKPPNRQLHDHCCGRSRKIEEAKSVWGFEAQQCLFLDLLGSRLPQRLYACTRCFFVGDGSAGDVTATVHGGDATWGCGSSTSFDCDGCALTARRLASCFRATGAPLYSNR